MTADHNPTKNNPLGEAPHSSTKSWRVWATRPSQQNIFWVELLQAQGFNTHALPLLEISAVAQDADIQAIKTIILDFDQYDKVIFVSQNAVIHTFAWLEEYWPQLPARIQYYAVGEKTATCIREQGFDVSSPTTAMNSEAMLAMPELQAVAHEKILICRGKGGLPILGESLKERGATVKYCELYTRQMPRDATVQISAHQDIGDGQDLFIVFSGETLTNLTCLFKANNLLGNNPQHLYQQPLLVPGERVAQLAQGMGFKNIIVAPNASETTMLNTLLAWTHKNATPC